MAAYLRRLIPPCNWCEVTDLSLESPAAEKLVSAERQLTFAGLPLEMYEPFLHEPFVLQLRGLGRGGYKAMGGTRD